MKTYRFQVESTSANREGLEARSLPLELDPENPVGIYIHGIWLNPEATQIENGQTSISSQFMLQASTDEDFGSGIHLTRGSILASRPDSTQDQSYNQDSAYSDFAALGKVLVAPYIRWRARAGATIDSDIIWRPKATLQGKFVELNSFADQLAVWNQVDEGVLDETNESWDLPTPRELGIQEQIPDPSPMTPAPV